MQVNPLHFADAGRNSRVEVELGKSYFLVTLADFPGSIGSLTMQSPILTISIKISVKEVHSSKNNGFEQIQVWTTGNNTKQFFWRIIKVNINDHFPDKREIAFDLDKAQCSASSSLENWGCGNAIKSNKIADWAISTKEYGAVGSWLKVVLSENLMYLVSRVFVLNRQYHDHGITEKFSLMLLADCFEGWLQTANSIEELLSLYLY